jgi:spore coat protein CotH
MPVGLLLSSLALAALLAANRAAPSPTAADLFDPLTLHDVHLYIHPIELARLRDRYGDNTYYPADLIWRNLRVRDVGVRSRGQDSRNPDKPGFHIDFNRYTPGRTFLGLDSLVLDNLLQDPAMMREHLAMALFRRMGEVAPRTAHARVFVNNEYQGLYNIVEAVDKAFLTTWLGYDDGFLFEYLWREPHYGESFGDDLSLYRRYFEPETHQASADVILYEPIRALLALVNLEDGLDHRAEIDARLDLEQLVRLVAIEAFMAEDDGFLGRHGMNNFLLYRDPDSTRHSFIVWDRDRAFSFIEASPLQRLGENALVRRALAYDDLREEFRRVLADTAHRAADDDWLAREIERVWQLISAAAYADDWKLFSNAELEDAMTFMREFARLRPQLVLDEIGALHPTQR